MKLYDILKKEREKANLKQSDLAAELNLSKQAISSYEHGESLPKLETLLALADLFNVSLDYLVGREGDRTTPVGSYQEEYLLDKFRNLSEDDKERLLRIADTLDV